MDLKDLSIDQLPAVMQAFNVYLTGGREELHRVYPNYEEVVLKNKGLGYQEFKKLVDDLISVKAES